LVYVSSGLHTSGRASLDDTDWTRRPWNGRQAYADSKLFVTTDDPRVAVSGKYWYHEELRTPAAAVNDHALSRRGLGQAGGHHG
jgi:hypothetical protein